MHRVQVGVPEEERRPGTRSGRRAVLLARLGHERAVVVMAARREEAERGVRQRWRLRNAGEHPLQGAELPCVARGVLLNQDRRLVTSNPRMLRVQEVVPHVRHHLRDDLVAVGLARARLVAYFVVAWRATSTWSAPSSPWRGSFRRHALRLRGRLPPGGAATRSGQHSTAATPASLSNAFAHRLLLSLGSFLDPIDVVGDQAVGFTVDVGRGLCRGRLDQAEHLPGGLIDPVPEVPHVMTGPGLESARCALATSSIDTPPAISWTSMNRGTGGLPLPRSSKAAGLDLERGPGDAAERHPDQRRPLSGADPEHNVTFDGKISIPVLTMHTTGDGLVVPENEQAYRSVVHHGRQPPSLLRQIFVHRAGHCAFTPAETITAAARPAAPAVHRPLDRHGDQAGQPEQEGRGARPEVQHLRGANGQVVPTAPAFIHFTSPPYLRPFSLGNPIPLRGDRQVPDEVSPAPGLLDLMAQLAGLWLRQCRRLPARRAGPGPQWSPRDGLAPPRAAGAGPPRARPARAGWPPGPAGPPGRSRRPVDADRQAAGGPVQRQADRGLAGHVELRRVGDEPGDPLRPRAQAPLR